jgi:hypothetical protein
MSTNRIADTAAATHPTVTRKALAPVRAVMVVAAAGAIAACLAGPAFAQPTTPATRAAMTRIKPSEPARAAITRPKPGPAAAPAATTTLPRVASVVFTGVSGGSTAPTITVNGTGFGAKPAGQPDQACGGTYTGDYYGPNFYFWDDTGYWESGLVGDCIGMVVSSWTSHQIVFSFGSAYGQPSYLMHNNDNYALKVKSLLYGGTVTGLS